ncbi:MAG: D-alanyl-D-alanine carboxypeptidase family protein [Cryomorphaceae bacterium]|nr:MAG: D-alanyl-D-alanine carboxypeptidase family protein [Cryomorphaceae bacterium]
MNSQNIDYKTLLGIEHSSLVGDSIKLEKNTFIAMEKMRKAALLDGIKIKVVSGFRDFERQKQIWNRKFKKFTTENNLSDLDAIKEIIRFSTIPGTSRHHWGTEIDVIDEDFKNEKNLLISNKYEEGGIFEKLKKWMDNNSQKFGFYLTYDNNINRKGFEYEPWHYSYLPESKKYLESFLKIDIVEIISKVDIKGKELFNEKFISDYINNNILEINPNLK